MKHGRNKRRVKPLSKKESKRDHAKKSKSKKTNTGNAGNAKKLQSKAETENLIYKELLSKAGLKFRKNEIKKIAKEENEYFKQRKKIARRFDLPLKKVQSANLYDNVSTHKQIKQITRGGKQLRYKGKFISKEAQAQIIKFSEILDREGVEYSLNELLQFPEIEKKILITKDKTPKQLFYWNLTNKVDSKSFGVPNIKIIDFDGKIIYEGKSSVKSTKLLEKINRKIKNLETLLEEAEEINAYFTIPIYETKREGETLRLTIDLTGIKGRIPDNIFNKYKFALNLKEDKK